MTKVYWITLRPVLEISKRYIQRNDLKLEANLTGEQYTCVKAVLAAILECLAILPTNPPTG